MHFDDTEMNRSNAMSLTILIFNRPSLYLHLAPRMGRLQCVQLDVTLVHDSLGTTVSIQVTSDKLLRTTAWSRWHGRNTRLLHSKWKVSQA